MRVELSGVERAYLADRLEQARSLATEAAKLQQRAESIYRDAITTIADDHGDDWTNAEPIMVDGSIVALDITSADEIDTAGPELEPTAEMMASS